MRLASVINYEEYYEVDDMGNVFRKEMNAIKNLKQGVVIAKMKRKKCSQQKQRGYHYVHLCKNNVKNAFLVHRLVAIAFIPNPNNYPQVNHIDGNKSNNSVSNLEWCSVLQNMRHSWDIGLRKSKSLEQSPRAKLVNNDVEHIIKSDKKGSELAKQYGVSCTAIYNIRSGRSWSKLTGKNT